MGPAGKVPTPKERDRARNLEEELNEMERERRKHKKERKELMELNEQLKKRITEILTASAPAPPLSPTASSEQSLLAFDKREREEETKRRSKEVEKEERAARRTEKAAQRQAKGGSGSQGAASGTPSPRAAALLSSKSPRGVKGFLVSLTSSDASVMTSRTYFICILSLRAVLTYSLMTALCVIRLKESYPGAFPQFGKC